MPLLLGDTREYKTVLALHFYELIATRPIDSKLSFYVLPRFIQQNKALVHALVRVGAGPEGLEGEHRTDRALILNYSRRRMFVDGWRFSTTLLADREVALNCAYHSDDAYEHLFNDLKADREIFLAHTKRSTSDLFEHAPQEFRKYRDLMLHVFAQAGSWHMSKVPEAFCSDWEVVVAAHKRPYQLNCIEIIGDTSALPSLFENKARILQVLSFGYLIPLDWLSMEHRLDDEILQFYLDAIDGFWIDSDPLLNRVSSLKPHCELTLELAKRMLELEVTPEIMWRNARQRMGEIVCEKLGIQSVALN